MSHVLKYNVADQIAYFRAYDTDGTAKTDLDSSTTGLTLSVFRVGASSVSIASLSDKAADDSTHADGAIRNVGGNLYTIDIPDAATATQVPSVVVRGSYTGGVVEGLEHPIVAYDPAVNYASATKASDIENDTQDIQSRLPAALVGGKMNSYLDSDAAADVSSEISYQITIAGGDWGAAIAVIAGAVYEEDYADHTTAGTYGKLFDLIRKANLSVDGEVTDAITPTTLTFASTVSATSSAYEHAVLLFVSGPLSGENSPILTYNNTNGVFVLEEPLTAAPSEGDEFVVIAGSHVHSVVDIQAGLATTAQLTTVEGKIDTIDTIADKLDTTVELDGAVYRFTENALEQAPTGGGGSGTGSFTISLTVKLSNGNTVGDCDVSLTTSSTSSTTNLIATGRTDPNGNVTFQLDSGVFYVWRQKLGVNFDDPAVLTVAGDGSATVS